ncbi:hypothetical protein, partial [uncultured Bilophila sp.]|uniref:hypothetical protein n=1 Tax=uncultured Bilophila sp. TaxID=529385 RepID=UPI0025F540B4
LDDFAPQAVRCRIQRDAHLCAPVGRMTGEKGSTADPSGMAMGGFSERLLRSSARTYTRLCGVELLPSLLFSQKVAKSSPER